jgi:hypothetical protein
VYGWKSYISIAECENCHRRPRLWHNPVELLKSGASADENPLPLSVHGSNAFLKQFARVVAEEDAEGATVDQ